MCDPVTALSLASTGASLWGADRQADKASDAISTQARNQAEEQTAAAQAELGERVKAARRARATARVAAGESGAAGQSFALSLQQSVADQNQDAALISKQNRFAARTTQGQADSAIARNSGPSALGAALQLGTAGYSGRQTYNANEALKKLSINGG